MNSSDTPHPGPLPASRGEGVFTQDWFRGNIANWTQWLAHLKGTPAKALEIGCFEGRSACWLMENILTDPGSQLTCMDTFQGGGDLPEFDSTLYERFRQNTAPWNSRMRVYQGPSKAYLPCLLAENEAFDFIYVDGSHMAVDVLRDGVFSFDLLKPGGIVVFDDYTWCHDPVPTHQPRMAIDAFLQIYAGRYELVGRGYQVAIRKTTPHPGPLPTSCGEGGNL